MADDEIADDINQRYQRRELLGHGAFKTVYKAYDTEEGIEVAWNQVRLTGVQPQQRAKILGEITILEQLKHPNIMDIYDSWETPNGEYLIFITEIMSSGTLKTFLRRAKRVKLKSIKKWCRQILAGLHYLHSHNPPVIHRDLKCDNIFMNGNRGEVKIGDLGLSICMKDKKFAVSVIGTPEFMAPELYAELYDEKIDIYAFGMCILEMVTGEYPYCECENAAQIFMKVINGVKPASMKLVQHKTVKDFIEMCTDHKDKRPSAQQLLDHPFMQPNPVDDNIVFYFQHNDPLQNITQVVPAPVPTLQQSKKSIADAPRVTLQSDKPNPDGSVLMKLYYKIRGTYKEIKFQFNLTEDTPEDVANEMVIELELGDPDIDYIAKGIQDALQMANLKIAKQYIPLEVDIEDQNQKQKIASPIKDKDPQTAGHADATGTTTLPDQGAGVGATLVGGEHKSHHSLVKQLGAGEKLVVSQQEVVVQKPNSFIENPLLQQQQQPQAKPQQPVSISTPPSVQPQQPVAPNPAVVPVVGGEQKVSIVPQQPQNAIDNFLQSEVQQHPTLEEIAKQWIALQQRLEKEELEMRERHKREREEFKKKYKYEPPAVVTPNTPLVAPNQSAFKGVDQKPAAAVEVKSNGIQNPIIGNNNKLPMNSSNPNAMINSGSKSGQNLPKLNTQPPASQQQPVKEKPVDLMVLISKNLDSLVSNAPPTPIGNQAKSVAQQGAPLVAQQQKSVSAAVPQNGVAAAQAQQQPMMNGVKAAQSPQSSIIPPQNGSMSAAVPQSANPSVGAANSAKAAQSPQSMSINAAAVVVGSGSNNNNNNNTPAAAAVMFNGNNNNQSANVPSAQGKVQPAAQPVNVSLAAAQSSSPPTPQGAPQQSKFGNDAALDIKAQ